MLKIKRRDLDEIICHSKMQNPLETCGILAGMITDIDDVSIRDVLKVYHCRNELDSPTEYRIEPEQQLQIFEEIERVGLDLLGFYHSHPRGGPRPSNIDRERANYVGYSYLIVSLYPVRVSSWFLDEFGFKKEEIQTMPK
ncbi:M67 family metallopeptidase [Candidatus Bathyarchaeota archaeon]|jgi:proteasome lid subunit RPN8/RPN11|nr:M67 family metallopeptidase [Candidatus Bathyarchaeota archaeon]